MQDNAPLQLKKKFRQQVLNLYKQWAGFLHLKQVFISHKRRLRNENPFESTLMLRINYLVKAQFPLYMLNIS